MNNTQQLARFAADSQCRYSWDMEALQRAFGEDWPRTLGNALKLFSYIDRDVIELFDLYDRAGMQKSEIACAIWGAGRRVYDRAHYEKMVGGEA